MEILNGKRFVLGTCYYPEHWKEEMWKEDLERMLATGIEVIRVAEFAWSKIEPTEGNFTYEFFDHFLDVVEETQMKVIFCTPSATPPAWLTDKYPEVLNVSKEGLVYRHGQRRHYNYNSPVYQRFCARITEKSAARYAGRKCIIGWQIDNEINCEKNEFYSESDTVAFRKFLQDKYGTLDKLNDAWGTVFWNQTYTAWEEIYVPRLTYADSTNPHEVLDYTRFVSASARGFAKLQSDILRRYVKPGDFITTNGIFENLDNHAMTEESLDFMTYDSYPNFAYMVHTYDEADTMKDRKWSRNLAEVRSISPIFGIMEQQSGANGWNTGMAAPTPRPGQLTLWTMQSIAHGADFVSYFRWRTCTFGTEIYWHGILDYNNRDNRRLAEIRETICEAGRLSHLAGSSYIARVAILRDYDNEWDGENDVWHGPVRNYSLEGLGKALFEEHIPFSYLTITEDCTPEKLAAYDVVFAPHMTIVNPMILEKLKSYVAAGGIFVSGARTGYKDMNGKCPRKVMPIDMNDLFGVEVREFTAVMPEEEIYASLGETRVRMPLFCDILTPVAEDCEVIGVYEDDYYRGEGAVTCSSYGKGRAYYYGSAFEKEAAKVFFHAIGLSGPMEGRIVLPRDCELAIRKCGEQEYYFLLNYAGEERTVILKEGFRNVLTGECMEGTYEMKAYDVWILVQETV